MRSYPPATQFGFSGPVFLHKQMCRLTSVASATPTISSDEHQSENGVQTHRPCSSTRKWRRATTSWTEETSMATQTSGDLGRGVNSRVLSTFITIVFSLFQDQSKALRKPRIYVTDQILFLVGWYWTLTTHSFVISFSLIERYERCAFSLRERTKPTLETSAPRHEKRVTVERCCRRRIKCHSFTNDVSIFLVIFD